MRWGRGLSLLLLAGCAAHAGDRALVGTWRMTRVEQFDSVSGTWRQPFGPAPTGTVTYGADGSHTMQFHATPVPPVFAAGSDRGATPAELSAAFYGYFAWYGRYTADRRRGIVVHTITGSLWPSWRGTVQPRPYRLRGDTLILGDTLRARRVLVRDRQPKTPG